MQGKEKKTMINAHLPFREDVIMGSPENDTITVLLLNVMIDSEIRKTRKNY